MEGTPSAMLIAALKLRPGTEVLTNVFNCREKEHE
jgi:hypothetical protein